MEKQKPLSFQKRMDAINRMISEQEDHDMASRQADSQTGLAQVLGGVLETFHRPSITAAEIMAGVTPRDHSAGHAERFAAPMRHQAEAQRGDMQGILNRYRAAMEGAGAHADVEAAEERQRMAEMSRQQSLEDQQSKFAHDEHMARLKSELGQQDMMFAQQFQQEEPLRELPAKLLEDVGTANAGIQIANELFEAWQQNVGNQHRINPIGFLKGQIPNTLENEYISKANAAVEQLGTALHGDKLDRAARNEIRKLLPSVTDNEQSAREKINSLVRNFELTKTQQLENFRRAGYNVDAASVPTSSMPLAGRRESIPGSGQAVAQPQQQGGEGGGIEIRERGGHRYRKVPGGWELID